MAVTSDINPDALVGAPEAAIDYVPVEGTVLHTEVRGSGADVLLVGAADEDAEFYRGIAERLATVSRVVTYDRRGTRRSGSEGWPTDSAQHADDAAALVRTLGLSQVTVLGASAGGIVALRLALRHPELLKTALCFEPGIFDATPEGNQLRTRAETAVEEYLQSHPGDWPGSADVLGRAAVSSVPDVGSLFAPPRGKEWFAQRADTNAESFIRGDLPLTGERFDLKAIANCPVRVRFAYGTASLPVFRDIASRLATARGEKADVLEGMGHSAFYDPDSTAAYVSSWL
jgi:pimeloyl-ACP methyl ester carboxylesterase